MLPGTCAPVGARALAAARGCVRAHSGYLLPLESRQGCAVARGSTRVRPPQGLGSPAGRSVAAQRARSFLVRPLPAPHTAPARRTRNARNCRRTCSRLFYFQRDQKNDSIFLNSFFAIVLDCLSESSTNIVRATGVGTIRQKPSDMISMALND